MAENKKCKKVQNHEEKDHKKKRSQENTEVKNERRN
jgi:hypothetical protein